MAPSALLSQRMRHVERQRLRLPGGAQLQPRRKAGNKAEQQQAGLLAARE